MKKYPDGVALVLGIIVVGLLAALLVVFLTGPGSKSTTAPVPESNRPVLALMAQEMTLEAQIADPSLVRAQQRATILEACDLASDLTKPSPTVASWMADHCGAKGEK